MKVRLTDQPIRFKSWLAHIEAGQYANGRIALELVAAPEQDQGIEGERIATGSVNLVDAFCGPRQVYVKEWSENAGMTLCLIQAGIIKPEPQREAASGFVVARCYDLTDAAFAKLCGDPAPITVQYLVTLTLKPGVTANEAPAEDAILGALEVGTEAPPEDLGFHGVQAITVQDHTPAAAPALLSECRRQRERIEILETALLHAPECPDDQPLTELEGSYMAWLRDYCMPARGEVQS